MKKYELIQKLEKDLRLEKEQKAFLKNQLETYDKAIKMRKETLEEYITEYNIRAQRDQEIMIFHDKKIAEITTKLQNLLTKEIKELKDKPLPKVVEKTPEEIMEAELLAKQATIDAEIKAFKEKVPKKIKIQKEADILFEDATKQITKQTPSNEVILTEKRDISAEMKKMTTEMNGEIDELARLMKNQKIMDKFAAEEGANAIWQGQITKGFRRWAKERGYEW